MIRSHLHFAPHDVDTTAAPLAKIQPFLEILRKSLTRNWQGGEHLSLGGMMVKCKSRYAKCRVRIPAKPINEGLKVFALCCSK